MSVIAQDPNSGHVCSRLLGAKLPQGTEPVLEVVGPGNLPVPDGLNIDRHDPEALAARGHTEEISSRRSRHLAAYDDAIAGDEDFLNVLAHNMAPGSSNAVHFDRGITSPA